LKNFSGGCTPGSPFKVRGGEGRKVRTEGERRGLGTQLGRRGVVWDREGEEGTRVIQRKGKGREEGKGREGRGGRKEEEEDMTWPPKKIPGSATAYRIADIDISVSYRIVSEIRISVFFDISYRIST
jgi:hypothetical protein